MLPGSQTKLVLGDELLRIVLHRFLHACTVCAYVPQLCMNMVATLWILLLFIVGESYPNVLSLYTAE